MRRAAIVVAAVVGLCIAYGLAHLALIEIGREVIVLQTRSGDGKWRSTRLWVVDHGGFQWVNGGGSGGWYGRLLQDPLVKMERAGETKPYRAVPVAEMRDRMHELLREKYGIADWWVRLPKDLEQAVPVRLDPEEAVTVP